MCQRRSRSSARAMGGKDGCGKDCGFPVRFVTGSERASENLALRLENKSCSGASRPEALRETFCRRARFGRGPTRPLPLDSGLVQSRIQRVYWRQHWSQYWREVRHCGHCQCLRLGYLMWRLFALLQLVQVKGLSWRTKGTLQTWQHHPLAAGSRLLCGSAPRMRGSGVLRRSAGLESRAGLGGPCAGGAAAVLRSTSSGRQWVALTESRSGPPTGQGAWLAEPRRRAPWSRLPAVARARRSCSSPADIRTHGAAPRLVRSGSPWLCVRAQGPRVGARRRRR